MGEVITKRASRFDCSLPDSKDNNKALESVGELLKRPPPLRIPSDGGEAADIINSDDMQCRFNPNSYHMLYVASKDAFLYKKQALTRAKQVIVIFLLLIYTLQRF